MPTSIRPGDVLAGRYRLDDLLSESRGARFWRAFDQVLVRPVAVHVIPAADDRAAALLEAARRSVTVKDRRFLRVLDADEQGDICYVVNEWGQGRSLDILLAGEGPLDPQHAAWITAETAAALAAAHDQDVTHSRLVPENVLLDHHGAVRVIGLGVDAALNGLPVADRATDVEDLVGCLYAALTGRWAGPSASSVPPAHREGDRLLRPRRVRGGIPRPLDELCAEVLCPATSGAHARAAYDLGTARGVADYLQAFAGGPADLSGLTATITTRLAPVPGAVIPSPATPGAPSDDQLSDDAPSDDEPSDDAPSDDEPTEVLPAGGRADAPPAGAVDDTTADLTADADPEPVTTTSALPPTALPAAEQPTQAGMPVFEDDGTVGWIARRTVPPPPPEAPEAPAVKPLFAPEPPPGTPARRPRHPGGDAASAATGGWTNTGTGGGTGTGSREFWPWDTSGTGTGTGSGALSLEEPDQPVPGRRWLRLAVLVAGIALGLLVGVILLNLSRGRTPLGSEPSTPTPSATQTAAPRPLTGLSAGDLDPQGDPQEENPELAAAAVDGDPASAWRTETYRQQLGPGGLKTGVGLVVDLGQRRAVDSIDLTFLGSPTSFSLYLTDDSPSAVDDLSPVAIERAGGAEVSVDLPADARGRYLTVWLTALPDVGGGFRAEVAEVVVLS